MLRSGFPADIPDPCGIRRDAQGVKKPLPINGAAGKHFLVRTSTIVGADIHDPKWFSKYFGHKVWSDYLVSSIAATIAVQELQKGFQQSEASGEICVLHGQRLGGEVRNECFCRLVLIECLRERPRGGGDNLSPCLKTYYQGVTNVHLLNVHLVLREISALLDPAWGS